MHFPLFPTHDNSADHGTDDIHSEDYSGSMHWGYLKLKGAATTIRSYVWKEAGTINPEADEVLEVPSRDKQRTITVNVYHPSTSQPTSAGSPASSPRPAPPPRVPSDAYLVNFYGSNFVIDALRGSDVTFLRRMADETGHTVLDVHYRLAPEHPFPAAFEDGEDVIKSLPEDAKVSVSGFAAGGNIALALSSTSGIAERVKSVFALYPQVDFSLKERDLRAPDPSNPGPMPAAAAAVLNDCYLYGGTSPKDPRVSPAYAPPTAFPKDVFLYTAAQDPHCISAENLVEKIKGAGKEVRTKRFEGVGSLFDKRPPIVDIKEQARDEVYGAYANYLKSLKVAA